METTEADDQLLWQLIEREIKAREWFILCDSVNARRSNAVVREMELVKSMAQQGKVIETIDLNCDPQTELYKLVRLSRRATVFLSYARAEGSQLTRRIRQSLLAHDYSVWFDMEDLQSGPFDKQIFSAIDKAISRGFVLLLLSPASLESDWCRRETQYALNLMSRSRLSNVVPVIVKPLSIGSLPIQISKLQVFDLTVGKYEERIEELVRNLRTREME